jgi:hypothetical protein
MSTTLLTTPANPLLPVPLTPLPEAPLVSVLIGNFNYARFLPEAIESVIRQSYCYFEICICDDGSTDESLDVIKGYAECDGRIRWLSQANAGHGAALNSAWKLARGPIVALLDADDIWEPHKLARIVSAFQDHPTCGLCTHRVRPFSESRTHPPIPERPDHGWVVPKAIGTMHCAVPPTSGLAFRREICEQIFPIPPEFRVNADGYLVKAAMFTTPLCGLRDCLAQYRIHDSNVTGVFVSESTILRELDAEARMFWGARGFLERSGRASIASGLSLANDRSYCELSLAAHLLTGKPISAEVVRSAHLRSSTMRARTLRLLGSLPRSLSRRLLLLWWCDSRLKRAGKVLTRLRLRP